MFLAIYFLFDFKHNILNSRGVNTFTLNWHLYFCYKESYCVKYVEMKLPKCGPKDLCDYFSSYILLNKYFFVSFQEQTIFPHK